MESILPGLMNMLMNCLHRELAERRGGHGPAGDARSPTGKTGDARDVAHTAVFPASDRAEHISGVMLPVDRWPELQAWLGERQRKRGGSHGPR